MESVCGHCYVHAIVISRYVLDEIGTKACPAAIINKESRSCLSYGRDST